MERPKLGEYWQTSGLVGHDQRERQAALNWWGGRPEWHEVGAFYRPRADPQCRRWVTPVTQWLQEISSRPSDAEPIAN